MSKLRFGIIGQYQSGKSLLINCLLRRAIATVGKGNATTHAVVNYNFAEDEYVEYVDENGETNRTEIKQLKEIDTDETVKVINVYLNCIFLKFYSLTDMPGLGYNDSDNKAAIQAIQSLDYAIVVSSNYKSFNFGSSAYNDFCILQHYNIPYYFVLNCVDYITPPNQKKWNPHEEINEIIAREDLNVVEFYNPISYPFEEGQILIANFMWYWYAVCGTNDEVIKRKEIMNAIGNCEIFNDNQIGQKEIEEISNFHLVEKIFSMDNRAYLELKKEFKEELKKVKDEVCPVGTIQAFAFNRIPEGWMVCDGRKLVPSVHCELFGIIGTTFGGDGERSFALPDLRGRFIRGWDDAGNIDKERKFGTYQEDALQGHSHAFNADKLAISKSGNHYHPLWCDEYDTIYDISGLAKSEKAKRMCYPSNTRGSGRTDLSPYAGEHMHTVSIVDPPIDTPTNLGIDAVRISSETRPNNCSLLYCIKVNRTLEGDGIVEEEKDNVQLIKCSQKEMECEVENNTSEQVFPVHPDLDYKNIISKL